MWKPSAILALLGCACATNSAWFKSGIPLHDGAADLYECATGSPMETSTHGGAIYLGRGVAIGHSNTRSVVDPRFHDACMEIKGYQWAPVPEKWPTWWIPGDHAEHLAVATAPWCPAGSSFARCEGYTRGLAERRHSQPFGSEAIVATAARRPEPEIDRATTREECIEFAQKDFDLCAHDAEGKSRKAVGALIRSPTPARGETMVDAESGAEACQTKLETEREICASKDFGRPVAAPMPKTGLEDQHGAE